MAFSEEIYRHYCHGEGRGAEKLTPQGKDILQNEIDEKIERGR